MFKKIISFSLLVLFTSCSAQKSDDVFEAVETVPEGNMYSPDDYQVEFG